MTILQLDPATIEVSQTLAAIPLAPAEVAEPIVADIKARGIDVPVIVNEHGELLDGRIRLRGALAAGLPTIPAVQRSDAEAATIILASLCHRKHYSKSALAYLSFPLLGDVVQESKSRRLENLRKGQQVPDSALNALSGRTAEEIAQALGFERRLFFYAQDVHKLFAKHPEARAQFEPEILAGEVGLGAVIAGIAGMLATKGKSRGEQMELDLWRGKLKAFQDPRKFAGWDKISTDTRTFMANEIAKTVEEAWPAEVQEAIARRLKTRKAEAR